MRGSARRRAGCRGTGSVRAVRGRGRRRWAGRRRRWGIRRGGWARRGGWTCRRRWRWSARRCGGSRWWTPPWCAISMMLTTGCLRACTRPPARARAAHPRPARRPCHAGRRARPASGAGPRPLGQAAFAEGAALTRGRWPRRARSAPISSRRRSPPCTARPPPSRTRTGRRSSRSTSCLPRCHPGPLVSLGKAVAVAMVHGPAARPGRDRRTRRRARRHHRFHAVRGHLLDMSGDPAAASTAYRTAARYATNAAEKRYLDLLSRR